MTTYVANNWYFDTLVAKTSWFKHIYSYYHLHSNKQLYSLQYNHDGIQKKVKRLIQICFPLKKRVHNYEYVR